MDAAIDRANAGAEAMRVALAQIEGAHEDFCVALVRYFHDELPPVPPAAAQLAAAPAEPAPEEGEVLSMDEDGPEEPDAPATVQAPPAIAATPAALIVEDPVEVAQRPRMVSR